MWSNKSWINPCFLLPWQLSFPDPTLLQHEGHFLARINFKTHSISKHPSVCVCVFYCDPDQYFCTALSQLPLTCFHFFPQQPIFHMSAKSGSLKCKICSSLLWLHKKLKYLRGVALAYFSELHQQQSAPCPLSFTTGISLRSSNESTKHTCLRDHMLPFLLKKIPSSSSFVLADSFSVQMSKPQRVVSNYPLPLLTWPTFFPLPSYVFFRDPIIQLQHFCYFSLFQPPPTIISTEKSRFLSTYMYNNSYTECLKK